MFQNTVSKHILYTNISKKLILKDIIYAPKTCFGMYLYISKIQV